MLWHSTIIDVTWSLLNFSTLRMDHLNHELLWLFYLEILKSLKLKISFKYSNSMNASAQGLPKWDSNISSFDGEYGSQDYIQLSELLW